MNAPSAAEPRILIVEDDRIVADTLRLYLERAGFRVAVAHDGASGVGLATGPDIAAVVLDVLLPGLDGRETCRRIRAASAVPILMLTARTTEEDRLHGFELGADDYVGKPFSPREVVARLRALLRRASAGAAEPPEPVRVGDLEIDLWARQVRRGGREVPVTPSELRLLEALARSPGRAFTREDLLARSFGPDSEALERTVDTHVANLRRKIEPGPRPRYLLTVPGVGYRLARPEELGGPADA